MPKSIPIRVTVVSLFVFLASAITLSLLYLGYYYGDKLARESMSKSFERLNRDITNSIATLDETNSNIVTTLSKCKFEDGALELFVGILEQNPKLYAIYTGDSEGRFYEMINLDISPQLRKLYGAKDSDRWVLIDIKQGEYRGEKTIILLDSELNFGKTKTIKTNYDPRKRPWYKRAIDSQESIKTNPYDFAHVDAKGVTYAHKMKHSDEVVAVDVLVNSLDEILQESSFTNSMISAVFDKDGKIVASSQPSYGISASTLKIFEDALSELDSSKTLQKSIKVGIKSYLVEVARVGEDEKLVSIAPMSELMEPYLEKLKVAGISAAILFLISLVAIWLLASIIVRPILALSRESRKIMAGEFDTLDKVDTAVKEIGELSDSMLEMGLSVRDHQKKLKDEVEKRTKELVDKNIELEKHSITDKLTGLCNRRKFDMLLDSEMHRSLRYGHAFSLIMLDMDDFKSVNDNFGHQMGDGVLKTLATICNGRIRDTDSLCRWGGEEFVVLCPETSLDDAALLANDIRHFIEKYEFVIVGKKTASFGVSEFRKDDSSGTLMERVDGALYEAKRAGKNRVVLA